MGVAHLIKKVIFGHRVDSETYIKYLRSIGMSIGERTVIYEPRASYVDETRPFLIKIGNDVKITRGVTILTHGYDWNVLAGLHDVVLGSGGGTTIVNNVFIGMNTTILKGVHIGNNVVIGAGSLVNKDVPDNCVAAGNPCKVICPIEDYYQKRLAAQKIEAFEMYSKYVDAYGKEPPMEVFDEFFFLFHHRDEILPPSAERQMKWHDRYDEVFAHFKSTEPEFDGYGEFLKAARRNKEDL